jgi:serine/threonine protein phosphatase PrpC
MRKAQQLAYDWPERALLIMHSDGVSNRWSLDAHEGLIGRHPAVVAAVLLRDFGRGRDDATVLVVRSDRRAAGAAS